MIRTVIAAAAAFAVAGIAPAAAPAKSWAGTWRNAANSVHIRTAPCGAGMCGTVVWANDKARADVAARGGTLVGAQLFRDFRRGDDGLWRGQVFIPDIGATLTGTIELQGSDRLVGSGCLFGNFGCKTQVWTRVR